jgi:hypothetical protein
MSGSMSSNYRGAMDQLICLAMFCRRVGIPHRIYGFTQVTGRFMKEDPNRYKAKRQKLVDIRARMTNKSFVFPDTGFDLVEFFHESMSLKDFNAMVGTLLISSKMMDMDPADQIDGRWARHWINEKMSANDWDSAFDYLGLGGTPLNDAILVSRDLMAKFRKEKNIQIMNFVCITDGESNHSYFYRAGASLNHHGVHEAMPYASSKKHISIFVDEESRIQTAMKFDNSHEITGMFARTVRQSQDANFVGFYIVGGSYDVRHVANRYMSYMDGISFQEKWRKNKGAVIPGMINFDEFYIINGGKNLRAQQAAFEEANTDMKKGQIARAFISAQNKRGASRAVLGKFIETIAA